MAPAPLPRFSPGMRALPGGCPNPPPDAGSGQGQEAIIETAIVILSVLFWIGTLIAVPLILIWLPTDYLSVDGSVGLIRRKKTVWRYPYWIAKNVLGGLFIIAGIAMLVLPGQGILTIVLGLALVNFPGKRKVILRTFGHHRIFNGINRLRAKAGKAPLEAPIDQQE